MISPITKQKIVRRRRKFVTLLLKWQQQNPKQYPWRNSHDPYEILIAEMLLRRTRADQASKVYKRFLKKFPDIQSLAASDLLTIYKIVKPLGLRYRSEWILETSKKIQHKLQNDFAETNNEFTSRINKNSRYLLNAIRCFAFSEDVAVFDVNVNRILNRVFTLGFNKEAHKQADSWDVATLLVPTGKSKQYNWALLDLGRTVCTSQNPRCNICPLSGICDYVNGNDRQLEF